MRPGYAVRRFAVRDCWTIAQAPCRVAGGARGRSGRMPAGPGYARRSGKPDRRLRQPPRRARRRPDDHPRLAGGGERTCFAVGCRIPRPPRRLSSVVDRTGGRVVRRAAWSGAALAIRPTGRSRGRRLPRGRRRHGSTRPPYSLGRSHLRRSGCRPGSAAVVVGRVATARLGDRRLRCRPRGCARPAPSRSQRRASGRRTGSATSRSVLT
jgi:hypothetical protein